MELLKKHFGEKVAASGINYENINIGVPKGIDHDQLALFLNQFERLVGIGD